MLFILSPAKTLDYKTPVPSEKSTQPQFRDQAEQLISYLQEFNAEHISQLMTLSPKLSELNRERYQAWRRQHRANAACRPCIFSFQGDVYQGLNAFEWDEATLERAQNKLRILSGLYGILRPLDLMHPYRLEMGTKLSTKEGDNLYEFWGEMLTDALQKELDSSQEGTIVNLASKEYFSAIKSKKLKARVITPVFKDWKNGKYKIISFYAKKARGSMASWALRESCDQAEDLKNYKETGYAFCSEQSTEEQWVFLRKLPES